MKLKKILLLHIVKYSDEAIVQSLKSEKCCSLSFAG